MIEKKALSSMSISQLEEFFSEYILGHTRPVTWLNNFEGMFRTRLISEKDIEDLNTVSEIWYRDQSKLDEYKWSSGRCHDYGENFFYGSNNLETTIRETNPENESFALIGEFRPKPNSKIPECQFAGIEILKHNSMWCHLLKDYKYQSERDKKLESFISKKFHKMIESKERDRYKYTIAFSKILLKNEGIDAIVYPSVASNLELLNYGFKAEYVDASIFCSGIWIYKVERTDFEIKLLPFLYGSIAQNNSSPKYSKISWSSEEIPKELDDESIIKYGL